MQRRLLGDEHPEVAHAMRYMAFGLFHQGKYEESERLYRQALAQYRKYLGNDNRHVASVLMELGNVLTFLERWDEAAELAAELVACERRRTGPETVEAAWALRLQAWWTYNGGKPAEAEPLAREALALQRKLRDENDPMVMNLLTLVASCGLQQGKVEEARDFAQQAQTRFARLPPGKVLVQERVSLASLLNILAATAFQQDQHRETESYVRQALKVLEPLALSDNPNVRETRSLSHFNLGSVLMAQQRYPEAEEHLKAALDAAQDDFARAELRDTRGQLRAWSGNWSGAAEDLTKAFELQPTNHWHTFRLAAVLLETGDGAAYRRLRTDSLAAFAGAADPWVAERIAKSAAMLPLSPKEAADADRLADKAVRDGEGPYHAWCQLTKALTEFRLGHHAAAADWAGKVVDAGKPYTRQTMGLMVLAMSRHALGQDAEARAALKQGADLYAGFPKPGEGGAIVVNWHDLVFDRILLREAESLILNGASAAR
ncbi:MAG: tetratricopeptide repeat protein [Verrucomicrobiales bacterium]|nr:tetratricopeptide repeat protein [Verrucomicrobiales bacterium]